MHDFLFTETLQINIVVQNCKFEFKVLGSKMGQIFYDLAQA